MTSTTKLERDRWQGYFDHVSTLLKDRTVEIDITALNIGDQVAARFLPLFGVSYDPYDDLIAVMGEGLNHLIRKPREVFIESDGSDLRSMVVTDDAGVSHMVLFSEPLTLPPPGADSSRAAGQSGTRP